MPSRCGKQVSLSEVCERRFLYQRVVRMEKVESQLDREKGEGKMVGNPPRPVRKSIYYVKSGKSKRC
jgi:hypothetical protein